VTDLVLREVALFQGAKVSLARDGIAVTQRNAVVVAKRDGLMRVYVTPGSGFRARDVQCELTIVRGTTEVLRLTDAKRVTASSTEDDTKTTFNFDVPGSAIGSDVEFKVALRETSGKSVDTNQSSAARFPRTGETSKLEARRGGETLKVVLVPVKYMADGSGRIPDVSPAAIERYRAAMYKMYPAAVVELTARAPFEWTSTISRSGSGFSAILQAMVTLRQRDNAADDVYYYGAFNPGANFSAFCSGSCVTGLSGLIEEDDDPTGRASVGVGFANQETTMVHEVGHAHGRSHAPCGVSGGDPDYPYQGGTIGVWGYDLVAKKLVSPSTGKDFMSYCTPEWVSDYTFEKLFERIQTVNGAPRITTLTAPVTYRFVDVGTDGITGMGETITLSRPPTSHPRTVAFVGDSETELSRATGYYYPYADLPGGYMLVPEPPAHARVELVDAQGNWRSTRNPAPSRK